jgi:hypothetical protein
LFFVTQPYDILAQKSLDPLLALLCAGRDATFAHLQSDHRSFLLGSLKALQLQESLFRPVLKNFQVDWTLTAKERNIIQAVCNGHYPVSDIEGAFYKYGGLHGIVALVIVFRNTDSILNQWIDIEAKAAQQWLVSNVSQLFGSQENEWLSNFIPHGRLLN